MKKSWQRRGFSKGIGKGQVEVFYEKIPTVFCPNCEANVLETGHKPLEVENETIFLFYSYECELGCGHTVFMI